MILLFIGQMTHIRTDICDTMWKYALSQFEISPKVLAGIEAKLHLSTKLNQIFWPSYYSSMIIATVRIVWL